MVCTKNNIWEPTGKAMKRDRARPGARPCEDSIEEDVCLVDRGHCQQYTKKGQDMDRICPGTCCKCVFLEISY